MEKKPLTEIQKIVLFNMAVAKARQKIKKRREMEAKSAAYNEKAARKRESEAIHWDPPMMPNAQ